MNIFIDAGAHLGESIDRAKYLYGDIPVIAFEAHPDLANRLALKYQDDPTVWICHRAVIDMEPGETRAWDPQATLYAGESPSASVYSEKTTGGLDGRYITVPALDIVDWIRTTVRRLHSVILKLDIEGAEYDVLERLVGYPRVLHKIGELYVDFHGHKLPGFDKGREGRLIERLKSPRRILQKRWRVPKLKLDVDPDPLATSLPGISVVPTAADLKAMVTACQP